MPYCTNCGYEVIDEMHFCPECGNKLILPKLGAKDDKADDHAIETESGKPEAMPTAVKKSRLYQQWIQHAGLTAEEPPPKKTRRRDTPVRGERRKQYTNVLYILLILIIVILCVGLAILLMKAL